MADRKAQSEYGASWADAKIKAQLEFDAKMARLQQQIARQTGTDNFFTKPPDQINTKLLDYPGADQSERSIRQSRNAFGKPGMSYNDFAPMPPNMGMNAFGRKPMPPVPPSKPKQSALPTLLAALLQQASNPNNSYPGADATYGGYGGAQQGLTSRDGPSRNPDVGERLSRFQMPTKEQFDLSLLDPRTRRDAAAVVRAKQKPMYGSK